MNRTALAIKMLIYLKSNGLSKKQEIADYLETNVRNIKELKYELETAGYTIEVTNGPYGGYQLVDTSFFPLASLTASQRSALQNASSFLLSSNQPILKDEFKEGYRQLIANENVYQTIQTETKQLVMSASEIESYLQRLNFAIKYRLRTKIKYQRTLTQEKEYVFEPYDCLIVNDIWYVVGFIKADHWASLKINRFIHCEVLDETYLFDKTFNVHSMLGDFGFKFNEVVSLECIIRNHPYVVEYIHGQNQEIKILDDQSFYLKVEIDSNYRAQQFVLQFGSNIEIIKPIWLLKYQTDEAFKIIKI